MRRAGFVLLIVAVQQVQGSVDKLESIPNERRVPENHTTKTALASLLQAPPPPAGFSPSATGTPSTNGHSPVIKSQPHGPVMSKYEPSEPEPAPWIPSWLDDEEKAEERMKAATEWKPPDPPPAPWMSPLMSEEEKEEELAKYNKYCEDLKKSPAPPWVTEWIELGGMDPPTPPPWVAPWARIPEGAPDDRDPPPFEPGPPPPPPPADGAPAPFFRQKKKYKGAAYPPWELQPKPWIPSWLDDEEQAEQKYEEALKYQPPECPEEPWLSPLADDEERAKVIQDHRTKVIEMGKPPTPQWVTDWLAMGGEVQPTPAPWKPSWQSDAGVAPASLGLPRNNPKWPNWVEEPKPWIPSWLDEGETMEQQYEAAIQWKPPPPPPEPWIPPMLPEDKKEAILEEHRKAVEDMGPPPTPSWVTAWLKLGEPEADEAGAPAPAPAPAPPLTFTSQHTANIDHVDVLFKEGDRLEFKVSDMTKKDGKFTINFEGPFDFTAEGDIKDKS